MNHNDKASSLGVVARLKDRINMTVLGTYRRQLDYERFSVVEYDSDVESKTFQAEIAENRRADSFDVAKYAMELGDCPPLFKFFLDGSRRTYKVADVKIGTRCLPVVAAQVGVCVTRRSDRKLIPELCRLKNVLALPRTLAPDEKNDKKRKAWFNSRRDEINAELIDQRGIQIDEILGYDVATTERVEDKAVAAIQGLMIEEEKAAVIELVENKKAVRQDAWLIKDGSLEYAKFGKEDEHAKSVKAENYRHIVGVSKSFNPELIRIGKNKNKPASSFIANLSVGNRTQAWLYANERVARAFAVWYLRLRNHERNGSLFDGVVKIEKMLLSGERKLDTDEIDSISAHIYRERTPVCFGRDVRWHNHLYPIYLTEQYIKSRYMSAGCFMQHFISDGLK